MLAVLIIPKVNRTIKNSKDNISKASVAGLVRMADNYYLEQKMKGNFGGCSYDFTNNTNTCSGIEFSGEKPESGKLTIDKNGKVGLAAKFDDICYVKKYNLNTFIEINNNEIECGENTYYIPELATTGDGLYEAQGEEGRLIYRGADPDNYIWLDENGDGISNTETVDEVEVKTEMYRIVSYESDGTIKVVRDNSIGDMAWDPQANRQNTSDGYYCSSQYGCNVWGNQSNTYYNDKTLSELGQDFYFRYYPNNQANTFSIKFNDNYGIVTTDSSLNTYLNGTWINTLNFKNRIASHNFNVGGLFYYDGYDGGDKGLLREKQEEQVYTWNGKIALINITEFVETSLSSTCTSVWSNYRYNPNNFDSNMDVIYLSGQWPCAKQNWNYKSSFYQWLLSAFSYNNYYAWYVDSLGFFSGYYVKHSYINTLPAFYLKSDVILSGSGTESDPYKIEL